MAAQYPNPSRSPMPTAAETATYQALRENLLGTRGVLASAIKAEHELTQRAANAAKKSGRGASIKKTGKDLAAMFGGAKNYIPNLLQAIQNTKFRQGKAQNTDLARAFFRNLNTLAMDIQAVPIREEYGNVHEELYRLMQAIANILGPIRNRYSSKFHKEISNFEDAFSRYQQSLQQGIPRLFRDVSSVSNDSEDTQDTHDAEDASERGPSESGALGESDSESRAEADWNVHLIGSDGGSDADEELSSADEEDFVPPLNRRGDRKESDEQRYVRYQSLVREFQAQDQERQRQREREREQEWQRESGITISPQDWQYVIERITNQEREMQRFRDQEREIFQLKQQVAHMATLQQNMTTLQEQVYLLQATVQQLNGGYTQQQQTVQAHAKIFDTQARNIALQEQRLRSLERTEVQHRDVLQQHSAQLERQNQESGTQREMGIRQEQTLHRYGKILETQGHSLEAHDQALRRREPVLEALTPLADLLERNNNTQKLTSVLGRADNINAVADQRAAIAHVVGQQADIDALVANRPYIEGLVDLRQPITTLAQSAVNINAVANRHADVLAIANQRAHLEHVVEQRDQINRLVGVVDELGRLVTAREDIHALARNRVPIEELVGLRQPIAALANNAGNINAVANRHADVLAIADQRVAIGHVVAQQADLDHLVAHRAEIDADHLVVQADHAVVQADHLAIQQQANTLVQYHNEALARARQVYGNLIAPINDLYSAVRKDRTDPNPSKLPRNLF